jgi:hypothetical protein
MTIQIRFDENVAAEVNAGEYGLATLQPVAQIFERYGAKPVSLAVPRRRGLPGKVANDGIVQVKLLDKTQEQALVGELALAGLGVVSCVSSSYGVIWLKRQGL